MPGEMGIHLLADPELETWHSTLWDWAPLCPPCCRGPSKTSSYHLWFTAHAWTSKHRWDPASGLPGGWDLVDGSGEATLDPFSPPTMPPPVQPSLHKSRPRSTRDKMVNIQLGHRVTASPRTAPQSLPGIPQPLTGFGKRNHDLLVLGRMKWNRIRESDL